MIDERLEMGAAGERVAAGFLVRRGASIVARNRSVGTGEVDLVVDFSDGRALVEVRSRRSEYAPIDAFDHAKASRLRTLSAAEGVARVDLVAVGFGTRYVTIHWLPWVL